MGSVSVSMRRFLHSMTVFCQRLVHRSMLRGTMRPIRIGHKYACQSPCRCPSVSKSATHFILTLFLQNTHVLPDVRASKRLGVSQWMADASSSSAIAKSCRENRALSLKAKREAKKPSFSHQCDISAPQILRQPCHCTFLISDT